MKSKTYFEIYKMLCRINDVDYNGNLLVRLYDEKCFELEKALYDSDERFCFRFIINDLGFGYYTISTMSLYHNKYKELNDITEKLMTGVKNLRENKFKSKFYAFRRKIKYMISSIDLDLIKDLAFTVTVVCFSIFMIVMLYLFLRRYL